MPAYFYPLTGGSDWNRMTSAQRSGVQITAIMNPMNGPVDATNSDYVTAVTNLRNAGGKVIGYLPSGYSGVQLADGVPACPNTARKYSVQNLIDCARWYKTRYNGLIDGIFVDEMNTPIDRSVNVTQSIDFYRRLYDGLKLIDPNWAIFGNAGAAVDAGYLRSGSSGAADVLVTYENTASLYLPMTAPSYAFSYPSTRFANLVHTAGGFSFNMLLAKSKQNNASYFFVTERTAMSGVNTFGALPLDWDMEVIAVRTSAGN